MFGRRSGRHRTSPPCYHHHNHHHHAPGGTMTTTTHTVETIPAHSHGRRPGLMARLRGRNHGRSAHARTTSATPVVTSSRRRNKRVGTGKKTAASRRSRVSTAPAPMTTTATTAAPRRKSSIGSRVSGAMMKLRGSLSGSPGLEAAGDRKMHGAAGPRTRRFY